MEKQQVSPAPRSSANPRKNPNFELSPIPPTQTSPVSMDETTTSSLSMAEQPPLKPPVRPDFFRARTVVIWDYENCSISTENAAKIARKLRLALYRRGYDGGALKMKVFGDFTRAVPATMVQLARTGFDLHHVPNDGKDSADRIILAEIYAWSNDIDILTNVFLISGDVDFCYSLHVVTYQANVNVLLSQPLGSDAAATREIASTVLIWNKLVKGPDAVLSTCEFSLVYDIKSALKILAAERIMGTKDNIVFCMLYTLKSGAVIDCEVQLMLEFLTSEKVINKYVCDNREVFFINRPGSPLNEFGGHDYYNKRLMSTVLQYLQSSAGLSAQTSCKHRYALAINVKEAVLPKQTLGAVLQLVTLAIR